MRSVQHLPLTQMTPMRSFHAGGPPHDHDHDDDSHSDFQAKKKPQSGLDEDALNAQIAEWVEKNDVVLFMKGTKKMPRCGFSNYVT